MPEGNLGQLTAALGADLRQMQSAMNRAERMVRDYERTTDRELKRSETRWETFGRRMKSHTGAMRGYIGGMTKSVFSLKGALIGLGAGMVLRSFTDVAASFEQMELKLNAITKGRGAETLEEINAWAKELPINTQKAVDSFAKLSAMGVQMGDTLDEQIEFMETLIDTSVIFGEDALPRVARALGQIQTLGKLSAEELNQLADAGINVRKYLSEAFGTTNAEEINKMGVTVERVINVMVRGLEDDFGGAAKEAMNTWQGVTAVFESTLTEISRQFADAGVFDAMKSIISDISTEMGKWLDRQTQLKEMGLENWFDTVADSAMKLADALGAIAKYAGLRSITRTVEQATQLSKEGRLGVEMDQFFKMSFLERQRLVDEALARTTEPGVPFRGRMPSRPSEGAPPPASSLPPSPVGGTDGAGALEDYMKEAQRLHKEAQASIAGGWVDQSQRLEEALAEQRQAHEQFKEQVKREHQEAQDSISGGAVNMADRMEKALADPERFFGPMEKEISGLAEFTASTIERMESNFSSLFLDVMQWKLTSFADFAKRVFHSVQQAAADYLGQIATDFLGSQQTGGLFEAILGGVGRLFGGGNVLPSMQVGFEPFHSGGVAGRIPRLHNGLAPDEYPAILRRGEGVFTPAQMKALGEEKTTPMHITLNINAVDAESFERLAERNPNAIVGPFMAALRQGGQLRSQMQEVLR